MPASKTQNNYIMQIIGSQGEVNSLNYYLEIEFYGMRGIPPNGILMDCL